MRISDWSSDVCSSDLRMTGARFQKRNSAERWRAVSEKVRSPLGAMRSRVLMSEQNLHAPPYGYDVVKFRTNFANKANVVETVTLERADEPRSASCRGRVVQ